MSSTVLETIEERRNFLQNIVNGEIELIEGGTLKMVKEARIFDAPCNIKNLVELFGGSLAELGKGSYGTVYKVCFDSNCNDTFVIKKILIDDLEIYVSIENPNRPENVEVEVFKRLNQLLLHRATPNIPFYMGDFICKEKNEKGKPEYYRYYMAERADGDLRKYIDTILTNNESDIYSKLNKEKIWKSLLFQIISVLHVIQKKYPNFRHNDLHDGNILFFKVEPIGNFKYIINGITYVIPNVGIRLGIWDFDFASIAGDLDNIKTFYMQSESFGIRCEPNLYTDMHKFVNTIIAKLNIIGESNITETTSTRYIPKVMIEFLNRVVPRRFQGYEKIGYIGNYSLIYNINYITPLDALNDSYFDEYRLNSEIDIIDSYDDSNINHISDKDLEFNVPVEVKYNFDCPKIPESSEFLKLINFQYKWTNKPTQYNIDRPNCLNSKNIGIILNPRDFIIEYKDKTEKWLIKVIALLNEIIDSSEDYENLAIHSEDLLKSNKLIISITLELLIEFIKQIYLPINYFELIALLCLDKAIFYIIHVHYFDDVMINKILGDNVQYDGALIYDTMVQFEKFLTLRKLEEKYLKQYQVNHF